MQELKLENCKVHRLLYLYIYYLHRGKKDRKLVRQIEKNTCQNIVN